MKLLLLMVCFFTVANTCAQDLEARDVQKLNNFGIDYYEQNLNDKTVRTDFTALLKLDKKREKRKTTAIVLTSLSVLSTAYGAAILANSKENPYGGVVGGLILASGIIEGGVAIPLFISSKRKKRERNRIIKKHNKEFED